MKKIKIVIISLMLLSFIVVGISFAFLNDVIPIHFGADWQPDQYGSKYFILIIPFISLIIGGSMLLIAKYGKVSDNYRKYLLLTCALIEVVLLVVTGIMVSYSLVYVEDNPPFDVSKIMMIVLGTLFIIMGNFMPKIEKNRTLGFKIKWSMYNEVTWQKTHRLAGFMGVIVGIIIFASGLFFNDMINFIVLMVMLGIFMIVTTLASYRYYKEETAKC